MMFWSKNIDFSGKAVLITGCDTGFGHELTVKLNSRGFRVYATVLDPNSMGAQQLLQECHNKDILTIIQMDVTNEQQINECYNRIKSDLDDNGEQLWALVNNAGVITYGLYEWGSFEEYTKLFDINVFGVLRVTRKFVPLIRQSMGRVILISSQGGRIGVNLLGAYCMTKSAILSFADVFRREMKKFRIKVITIEPGIFKTQMIYCFEESMNRNWKNTDPIIRQTYGETYFQQMIYQFNTTLLNNFKFIVSEDLNIVVEDMIKAIINPKPRHSYRPIKGKINGFIANYIEFIPKYFINKFFNQIFNSIPESMTKNK